MYRFSVTICFIFASLVIALFTLIISDNSFKPATDQAAVLVQDLTAIRIWIVVAALALYSWKSATKQPRGQLLAVVTAVAWIMFLEDYMVLDGALIVASHSLAQLVILTRPIFLIALTYVAFKQWEVDLI